jgi:hypothetical protein
MLMTRFAQAGHDAWAAAGTDPGAVFAEVHVVHPAQPVLDALCSQVRLPCHGLASFGQD